MTNPFARGHPSPPVTGSPDGKIGEELDVLQRLLSWGEQGGGAVAGVEDGPKIRSCRVGDV